MSERKVVGRNVAIALGIICIILAASLVGAIADYAPLQSIYNDYVADHHHTDFEYSQTQSWLNGNLTLVQKLKTWLEGNITYYQSLIASLNSQIDSLTKYFFVQDANFTTPLGNNAVWGVEAWNKSNDSICEIKNGMLHLFYNGTIDDSYGNSGVFQGAHIYGGFTYQLLIGNSSQNAYSSDCVVLPKDIPSGKFLLDTNFTVTRMGFNLHPTVYDRNFARVNLGITLMCAINDQPLNLTGQNLWLDIYFAGYNLNETVNWSIPRNSHYVDQIGDIHAGYFVGEVPSQDFGKWIPMHIDLGDYITKTLNLITKIDIKTIRVYGFIVFVECLGAYAEVKYDHINTITQ